MDFHALLSLNISECFSNSCFNLGLHHSIISYDILLYNLIKIISPHWFPILYQLFTSRRMGDLEAIL